MPRARILNRGLLACFPAGLADPEGEPVHAEISAVAFDGEHLLLASDKPVPGEHRSSVFSVRCEDGVPVSDSVEYLTAPLIAGARKFEDFAYTVDGAYVLACTGFDRVVEDSADQHQYNNLLIWPRGRSQDADVVAASDDQGVRSSVSLRADLSAALDAPYFKIEGLAAVPAVAGGDDRLLFGIREVGKNHAQFDYVCAIVSAPYRIENGQLTFTGPLVRSYAFDPAADSRLRFPVGLSSLEYDPHHQRLLLLTSFETEDETGPQIGGYLWTVSLEGLEAGRPPQLVENEDGGALEFVNKAEGVAVMDAARLLVVYDNDRHLAEDDASSASARRPHEAPYTLIALD